MASHPTLKNSSSSSSSSSRSLHKSNSRKSFKRTDSNANSTSHSQQWDFGEETRHRGGLDDDLIFSDLSLGGGFRSLDQPPLPSSQASGQSQESSPKKNAKIEQRIGRSAPIAIDLPPRRRSGPVDTPPEPLSARGDLPGGYFPHHEEIARSYKPHPFYPENSFKLASNLESPKIPEIDTNPQYTPLGHPKSPNQDLRPSKSSQDFLVLPTLHLPPINKTPTLTKPTMDTNNSPVMGKYHPSNYKPLTAKTNSTPTSKRSEPTSTTDKNSSHHSRQNSDIRRKLQQYQRDMLEQAALASRMVVNRPKPTSPRLAPLGSPGPVTPMVLEEGGGYLVAGFKGKKVGSPRSPGAVTGEERNRGSQNGNGNGSERVVVDAAEMIRRMVSNDDESEEERERRRQRSIGGDEE